MDSTSRESDHRQWLAATVRTLLAEKYDPESVPGTRRIAADIAAANDGRTISHARLHDIMTGAADNLTDRTRMLLARFFDKSPSYFFPASHEPDSDSALTRRLAARFASLRPAQLAAIRQALEIVDGAGE